MTWHTPKTWSALTEVTASDFNYEIRDLLNTIWVGTAAGDMDYYTSSTAKSRLAKGTAYQGLAMNAGATAPSWQDTPQKVLTTAGDILYASGANTLARRAIGTNDYVLTVNAGAPAWVSRAKFVPLTTPLTSTSWDGDSKSTEVTSTLLDMSSVFTGYPTSGVQAVLLWVQVMDSATWGTDDLWIDFGPSGTYWYAGGVSAFGGDVRNQGMLIIPTDANGDIYYRINASGASSMDIWIRVWGYWTI